MIPSMRIPLKVVPQAVKTVIETNSNLKNYLIALDRGREATPHSWLYENEASAQTLSRWIKILTSSLERNKFGDLFYQLEEKQLPKFGFQGEVPPITSEAAQDVLEPLYESSLYDDEMALSHFFPYTKRFAQFLFGSQFGTMDPLDYWTVVDNMRDRDTLSTNSGFPRFREREQVKDAEVHDATTGKAFEYPAIVLFRQYNGKLRPVWMYPMSMNLIEASFGRVIMDVIQKRQQPWIHQYVSPWIGFDQVKKTLTVTWAKGAHIVGGDTTAMDAHMRKAQLRLCFEIVKWLFKRHHWDALYRAMMQVNTIPLLVWTWLWAVGSHGLASGSWWTQLSETVLQMFMAWLKGLRGQGIGDDFEWLADWDGPTLVDYLAQFGLPAKPEKQTVGTTYLDFLQRRFCHGFFSREAKGILGAYYPTIRALNSSLHPEKFHKPKLWNSDMFCARQYMILENTVDDPCFDKFVEFVVHGQKDLIRFAKKNASELSRIQSEARLVPGLTATYNQEKRDKPLSSFESIRVAQRL